MVKRYISKIRGSLTLKSIVTIDGKEEIVTISFTKANIREGKCFFITDDEKEQSAIEASREFKNGFMSVISDEKEIGNPEESEESQKEPEENLKKDFIQLEASKKQLAIEELIAKFPELAEKLAGKVTNAQIEAIANENNCTFPNLVIS